MSTVYKQYRELCEKALDDKEKKLIRNENLSKYKRAFHISEQRFGQLNLAKQRAANFRSKAVEYLDNYLIDFEAAFQRKGGKIIWCCDADEANRQIQQLLEKRNLNTVVKSKSSLADEIELKRYLREQKIEVTESDLGDFLQEKFLEPGEHPIMPALHHSEEESINKLKESLNVNGEEYIKSFRSHLKLKQKESDVKIIAANFLLADSGIVVTLENEGNVGTAINQAKTLVILASIEKIVANINELDVLLPLLATHATGQFSTSYTHFITGPKSANNPYAPEELILVLIDNNRSNLLNQPNQRKALTCIKCAACLNNDEVYSHIGGAPYRSAQKGPIGALSNQYLMPEEEDYHHLNQTILLNGKLINCCPVKIDFDKIALYTRNENVKNKFGSKSDSIALFFWKNAVMKRSKMDKGGAKLKGFMLKQFFKKSWGEQRSLPIIASKSFNELWRERKP